MTDDRDAQATPTLVEMVKKSPTYRYLFGESVAEIERIERALTAATARAEEAERELNDLALRYNVNREPVKCWFCPAEVPAFKGSIIGPSCDKCHRQMSSRPSDD